jgi:S1-C subfamily serine protease
MQLRLSLAVVTLAVAGMLASAMDAESGPPDVGSSLVPRIVARGLPAVVSITALLAHGRIVRASFGVVAVSVTPQVAYANALPMERGALVIRVEAGGAGEVAGIEAGDVITAIAGTPSRDLHHLHEVLSRHRAGEAIEISVWREGQALTLQPVLKEES